MDTDKGRSRVARAATGATITVVALAVAAARIVWPNLDIDAVAVTLLAIAALPWLGNIFKSFNTPFGGAEYRDVQNQIEAVRETAENARMAAEVSEARDLARHDVRTQRDQTSVAELAATYDVTRANMEPGSARTDEMTGIVGRMVALYEAGAEVDVNKFLTDAMGGKRLAAYVRLYVKPEGSYLLPLVDAFVKEAQHFCQYWALRGLFRIVEAEPDAMDRNTLRRLEKLADGLPANSDRRYQIGRILARY